MKFHSATLLLLCFACTLQAQDPGKLKFGKLSRADFEPTVYSVDSNASAVVLADIGSSEFTGNAKGWFSLEYKFFRRARVLNRKGYGIADVEISLYTDDGLEEDLESLRAVTYNLEDGKVVETKLDIKGSVFKTRVSKNVVVKKFTLPAIREGSIIEYEYKLKSDFLFNMQPWEFQGDYPVLWSDYKVGVPQFLNYVFLVQGYHPFHLNASKDKVVNFSVVTENTAMGRAQTFTSGVTEYRWVMKDVPPLKEERFTSTLRNHVARIEFQLSEYREPLVAKNIMGTWPEAMQRMLAYEEFGMQLEKDKNWLNDVLDEIGIKEQAGSSAAKQIYAWVRDNFTNEHYTSLYVHKPMRQVYKTRSGSSTDINLLLVALLRKAGLKADPVILSTRSHGWVYPKYPLINRFNYVVVQTRQDNQPVLLDASKPRMGFGRLEPELYNGHARVVNATADSLTLNADQLIEASMTSIVMINGPDGSMQGSCERRPGYVESTSLRDKVAEHGNGGYITDLQKGFGRDVTITDLVLDSMDNYDLPIRVRYKFELKADKSDLLYFNPMLGEGWKENPFKSAVRNYPVEIPYQIDETYLLRFDIPEGYEVDELPKQLKMKLNADEDGSFEYLVSASGGSVMLRSRLKLKRCYFLPEEYNFMRDFFALVVKKHGEQLVFKKKSP